MRILPSLLLAALLAACATPAERAARAERDMDEMMTVYGPACERLGHRANSDAWRDCVLRLAQKDAIERNRYPTATGCFGNWGVFSCASF